MAGRLNKKAYNITKIEGTIEETPEEKVIRLALLDIINKTSNKAMGITKEDKKSTTFPLFPNVKKALQGILKKKKKD